MTKALVIGASGLLGSCVFRTCKTRYDTVGTSCTHGRPGSRTLDIADERQLRRAFAEVLPDVVINCAAMTDVEECERDPEKAERVNADAVAKIVEQCAECRARLVHLSTDYVFDGTGTPYEEDAATSPLSHYGRSKRDGEIAALEYAESAVLRVAILYGYNGPDDKLTVPTSVLRTLRAGRRVHLDGRRIKFPTLVDDVSDAIMQVLEHEATGIFHVCNPEPITKYEWGRQVAGVAGCDSALVVRNDNLEKDAVGLRPYEVFLKSTRMTFEYRPLQAGLATLPLKGALGKGPRGSR